MKRALAAILSVGLLIALAQTAGARSISDPKESSSSFDIRSIRLVRPKAHTLSWTVRTWGKWKRAPFSRSPLTLWLDVAGTKNPDYRVEIYENLYPKFATCELKTPKGKSIRSGHLSRPDRHTGTCRFSTKGIKFRKLHWRASVLIRFTTAGAVIDSAPNTGWVNGI
jgi:hypothetical protein